MKTKEKHIFIGGDRSERYGQYGEHDETDAENAEENDESTGRITCHGI